MKIMWNFILTNKEWIFSGFGVAIVTLIISLITNPFRKKKKGFSLSIQNNNYGISAVEVRNIAESVFIENFPKLQATAKKYSIINKNLFIDELIHTIEYRLRPDEFNTFKNPDVQFILLESILTAARKDSPKMREILSNLIVDRVKNEGIESSEIIYNEAIKSISRLTSEQIKILTIIDITSSFIYLIIKKEILFTEYDLLESFLNVQCNILESDLDHLKYCGLITSVFPYVIDRKEYENCNYKILIPIIERCKEIIDSNENIGFNQIQPTAIGKAISQTNLSILIKTEINILSKAPLVLGDIRAKNFYGVEGSFEGDVTAYAKK